MKKRLLLSLIIILSSLSLYAQPKETPKFKGIELGCTYEVFASKAKLAGCKYNQVLSKGTGFPIFESSFAGLENCTISPKTTDKNIVYSIVILTEEYNNFSRMYDAYYRLKLMFIEKYGVAPDLSVTRFDEPYYNGDGFEMQALRVGKCHYYCLWKNLNGIDIYIGLGSSCRINIFYEITKTAQEMQAKEEKNNLEDI